VAVVEALAVLPLLAVVEAVVVQEVLLRNLLLQPLRLMLMWSVLVALVALMVIPQVADLLEQAQPLLA
tara:strand:+ start:155 stop:358 length:204 start_codon:yes stop_codon:yes gene_type:complete